LVPCLFRVKLARFGKLSDIPTEEKEGR